MLLITFDPLKHISALVSIWNAACGANLAITPRFVEYNTRPATSAIQAGRIAMRADTPVGFCACQCAPKRSTNLAARGGLD